MKCKQNTGRIYATSEIGDGDHMNGWVPPQAMQLLMICPMRGPNLNFTIVL